jgi:hypothetical protein
MGENQKCPVKIPDRSIMETWNQLFWKINFFCCNEHKNNLETN